MADVIDIVHRLTYDVDAKEVEKATAAIGNNLKKIEDLQEANKKLAEEAKKAGSAQAAAAQQATQANNRQIATLTRTVDAQVGALATQAAASTASTTATVANTAATAANTVAATASATAVTANTAAVVTTAVAETAATVTTTRFNAALLRLYATLGPMLLSFAAAAAAVIALQGATYLLGKAIEYITGANSDAAKRQAVLNEINTKAVDIYSKQAAKLELMRYKLADASVTEKDRLQIIKDYNREADAANRIDSTQVNNLSEINRLIDAQIELIKERAIARAAEAVVAEKYEALFKAQVLFDSAHPEAAERNLKDNVKRAEVIVDDATKKLGIKNRNFTKELLAVSDLPKEELQKMAVSAERFKVLLDDQTRGKLQVIQKNLDRIKAYREGTHEGSSGTAAGQATLDELRKDAEDTLRYAASLIDPSAFSKTIKTRDIENVFATKLAELKAKLASLTAATFQSDETIQEKAKESLNKTLTELDRLYKNKKITAPQLDILKGLAGTISDAELTKDLTEFHKKRTAAQKKIDDELNALILEDSKQRTDLIRDDFERQSALLDIEYQRQVESLQKAKDALLKTNADNKSAGLISPETARSNTDEIERVYADLFDNLVILINRKKAMLSLSAFDEAIKYDKVYFGAKEADIAEEAAARVKTVTDAYLKHTISYKRLQKELTRIAVEETNKRKKVARLPELQNELDLTQRKLEEARTNGLSSNSEINAIQARANSLRIQIADLNKQIDEGDVTSTKNGQDANNERLKEKISAYRTLMDVGVQAYRAIAQAQEDQVERDITAQEQRVTRAQAIADRGNAKALQQEEERLNKLQKEREKFARTQLAINAAQTLSSSILAIASAAGQSGAAAIVIVPAVIAALAAGFAAVKALSVDSQGFRDGVVDLRGPGTPTSDSIPANLSRGESVVTAAGTAKHKEILEGMNAGRQYKFIGDKILEMSQGTGLQMLQSAPLKGIVVVNNGGGQADKKMLQRLEAIEQAVLSKPTQTWHLDRRGFVAMYQDEISFQDKMKKL